METVFGEDLRGVSDHLLYEICQDENRCLVTLDLDFADVLRFPPYRSSGIAVIRVPGGPSIALLEMLVRQLLDTKSIESIEGALWVVEPERVRIHQREPDR